MIFGHNANPHLCTVRIKVWMYESLDDILISNYKMKIRREKAEVTVCSKDFEITNIKIDDNALKLVL